LGFALLIVLSVLVIPALLLFTGIPVEVVYVVPLALCFFIMIKRVSGDEPRKGDELAKRFGLWVGERISQSFNLRPRPEPTTKERLIAAAVGTAAVIGLGGVAFFNRADPSWYGVIVGLWLVTMFTVCVISRPNLQQPNDDE